MSKNNWEYGGIYRDYDMSGVIELPHNSKVSVCDWTKDFPAFMKEADTVFVDPPWNIGNVNTFYHKAGLKHLQGFDFLSFSIKLFERLDEIAPETLFIEMGKQFLGWYLIECQKRFKYVTFYNSTYYRKNYNKCYVIHSTNNRKARKYKALEDLDEEEIIKWICTNHEYQCIGDLCMGTGLVGKYAFLNNKRFVGTELNPKRLALLLDFIVKKGKEYEI